MKEIKLMNLTLKNFKGIKDLAIDFNGQDLKAYGDNGTGKTTLYDAFLWVLFNKDSNNRADFSIKTLKGGKEINNLDHSVEAQFWVSDPAAQDEEKLTAVTLKKVYKEKYTRKRGAPIAEFTGHETNHYIDGVPVKKKEYDEKVSSIVDEDVFKLLTSPTFFNENIKWQDRRKTLLEVCGDIGEEDVLAFNSALNELPVILQGRTIEDHKKVIASRRAEINKELNMIPVRIDEINNSLSNEEIDVPSIEADVAVIEKQLDEHATQINNIKNGSAIIDKQALARQLEIELKEIQQELESESVEKGHKVNAKLQEEQSNVAILKRKKEDNEHKINIFNSDVKGFDARLSALREDWAKVNGREYEHTHSADGVCPTCNQNLPAEQIEEARQKAVAAFNLKKSNELEEINNTGKAISEKKVETLEQIEVLQKSNSLLEPQIVEKEKAIVKLTDELEALRNEVRDARQDEKYQVKLAEQTKAKDEIKALQENAQQAVSDIEKEVAELRSKRSELNAVVAKQAQATASKKRIAELEAQQKELATEFEELEKQLHLTEEYTRSKVELLEERINSKFKYARFKLFAEQVNGGLQEVCETTFEGVPYSSGLNNAARINVGIDIINTLTEHYGIRAPIFVDNSEAVTRLADTDSQLISLVVSEQDKQLRIETQSSKEGEVA